MAKVITVDPFSKTVCYAELTIEDIRRFIGCELLEPVRCGGSTTLWVNEEGMLKNNPTLWVLAGRQLIAGKAVFAGNGKGDEGFGDVEIPGELAASVVSWIPERLQTQARNSVPLADFYAFGDEEAKARVTKRAEEAAFSAQMLAIQGEGAQFQPLSDAEDLDKVLECMTRDLWGTSRKQSIQNKTCVRCTGPAVEFSDPISAKEYALSGLCEGCQEQILGSEE